MIIKRDYYLKKIIKKSWNGRIKIITGVRRCGKSFLLFNLYRDYLLSKGAREEQIISIALDARENFKYRDPFKLYDYIKERTKNKNETYYVLIDEIQLSEAVRNPYIDSKEKSITFLDILLSLMKQPNLDIYVTGSNSRMLSTDVLTQFRDRGDEIYITPLLFSEVYDLYENKSLALKDYMAYGGMPHIYTLETDEEKSNYLKGLFKETYIKDILERNNIHNESVVLELLLNFISSIIGSLTNPSKLSKRFLSEQQQKVSQSTIARYLNFFEESFIISHANRYDVKGSRYFSTTLKYYFVDIGLRNAILNFRQTEESHIMENIIYNELFRRGYDIDVGVIEYDDKKDDRRKITQLEVDFVINQGHKRYYIQSALNLNNENKIKQETASLKRIKDSFKKIVIVGDYLVPRHDDDGILYISIYDFLLDEKIIDL